MNTSELRNMITFEKLDKLNDFNNLIIAEVKKLIYQHKVEPFMISGILGKEQYNVMRTAEVNSAKDKGGN